MLQYKFLYIEKFDRVSLNVSQSENVHPFHISCQVLSNHWLVKSSIGSRVSLMFVSWTMLDGSSWNSTSSCIFFPYGSAIVINMWPNSCNDGWSDEKRKLGINIFLKINSGTNGTTKIDTFYCNLVMHLWVFNVKSKVCGRTNVTIIASKNLNISPSWSLKDKTSVHSSKQHNNKPCCANYTDYRIYNTFPFQNTRSSTKSISIVFTHIWTSKSCMYTRNKSLIFFHR